MLTISVRLTHETIRAGSPDDVVMTGDDPVGEWPPSPARLFSALVAADGTRKRCTATTGEELAVLEALEPPEIAASPLREVEMTRLPSRYVVQDRRSANATQEYVARSNTLVHPGVRMSPRDPVVQYSWAADLEDHTVDALRTRALRIGYLGAADSPVVVSVSTDPPDSDLARWYPSDHGTVTLPVPYAGFTDELDIAFDAWSEGRPMRRAWIRSERARYGIADVSTRRDSPVTLWFRFSRAIPGSRALAVSEAIRATVLDRYQSVVDPENTDTVPWQLHGHAVPSGQQKPYQLARYLTLGNVGGRYSDGRIHGCAIWLPPNIEPSVEEGLRRALWGWSSLRSRTVSTEVEPYEGELRPWSTVPKRWTGPAIRWRSVTPIVAETGVKKRGPNLEQVQRWFRNAGHEPPSDIEVSPAPRIPGAQRLRPSQVHHHRERSAYPYFWIDARFDAEVEGPLCVGRGRHLGMGLLAPVHTRGDQLHKESQR